MNRVPGRRGIRLARQVLPLLQSRVDSSPMETRLRLLILDAGLPRPVVNRPLYDSRRVVDRPSTLIERIVRALRAGGLA